MAKPGFLKFLAPIAAVGAGLAAPELLGAFGPAEAGAGAAEAGAGAAEAAAPGFLVPGTDIPLAGAATAEIPFAPALAGLAAEQAATTAPSLLAAGPSEAAPAIAPTAAAPLAATTPSLTAADVSGVMTPISASPISASSFGAALPPGVAQTADLSIPGPQAGQTVNMFATEPGSSAAPSGFLVPGSDVPLTGMPPVATSEDFLSQQLAAPGGAGPADIGGSAAGSTVGDYASKAGDYLLTHPGLPLTLGIFGSQLLKGQTPYPAETSVGNLAAAQQGMATSLTSPLQTGVLPPGAQQEVSSAEKAAEATTRSAFGNMGLSGSTMEADAIAQAKQNAAIQQYQIANSLLGHAAQFSSLSGEDYQTLLRAQATRDAQYQAALQNFARALGGAGYQPAYTAAAATV